MSADLYEVIEDSITDAETPEAVDTPDAPEVEPTTPVEATPEAPEATIEEPAETTLEVSSPGAKTEAPKSLDEFEKKFGISAQSSSGRENRIPYPRVKKIVEKAVKDGVDAKTKELETTYAPKIQEFETKIKDYEGRLGEVAQFEDIMVNDVERFQGMLRQIPSWQPFFKQFDDLKAAPAVDPSIPQTPVSDGMPEPDQKLSDGTMVYSMDGLKALLQWQAGQVESRVTKQVEERYKPLESEWQAHQKVKAVIPQVQAQITEARTWPLFNENEEEIVKALQSDGKLSLERAYQKVVYPKLVADKESLKEKLTADRTKMREELLQELKTAPTKSTSAPSTGSKSSAQPASTGPRSLEDVIADSVKTLKQ